MHDHIGVGLDDFAAMPGDGRRQFGILGDFGIGQDRIESFGIEIVKNDLVSRGASSSIAASAIAWQKLPGR